MPTAVESSQTITKGGITVHTHEDGRFREYQLDPELLDLSLAFQPITDENREQHETALAKWQRLIMLADQRISAATMLSAGGMRLDSDGFVSFRTIDFHYWEKDHPNIVGCIEEALGVPPGSLPVGYHSGSDTEADASTEAGEWKLEGYDTFAGELYRLDGTYPNVAAATKAAQEQLAALEVKQPSDSSGGQDGIQDQVIIVRPDGTKYRFSG